MRCGPTRRSPTSTSAGTSASPTSSTCRDPTPPRRSGSGTRRSSGSGSRSRATARRVGERDLPDGSRTSALRFGSAHPLSIIREGSGYWKYVPTPDGIRFLTSYDYTHPVRHRRARLRPARLPSADRLGDGLELRPPAALARARASSPRRRSGSRSSTASPGSGWPAIFLYHGLVPKLLGPDPQELALVGDAGIPAASAGAAVVALGIAEVVLAVLLLARWTAACCRRSARPLPSSRRWPSRSSRRATSAGRSTRSRSTSASLCLAAIDLVALPGLPSARRCLRRPAGGAA